MSGRHAPAILYMPAIVYMYVAGDIDMTCKAALVSAAAHTGRPPAPDTVYIDLAL